MDILHKRCYHNGPQRRAVLYKGYLQWDEGIYKSRTPAIVAEGVYDSVNGNRR